MDCVQWTLDQTVTENEHVWKLILSSPSAGTLALCDEEKNTTVSPRWKSDVRANPHVPSKFFVILESNFVLKLDTMFFKTHNSWHTTAMASSQALPKRNMDLNSATSDAVQKQFCFQNVSVACNHIFEVAESSRKRPTYCEWIARIIFFWGRKPNYLHRDDFWVQRTALYFTGSGQKQRTELQVNCPIPWNEFCQKKNT